MEQLPEPILDQFLSACHRVGQAGLVRCSSGNLSYRVRDHVIAISGRGSWLSHIRRDQVAICRLDNGSAFNEVECSVESKVHLGVMRVRQDVQVVLHFQSPSATAIACGAPEQRDFFVIPEIPLYVGKPAAVGFLPPGSAQLADAVAAAMVDHDMVFMQNHGMVVAGKSYDDVIQKACFIELACEIMLKTEAQPLTEDQVNSLKDYLPIR